MEDIQGEATRLLALMERKLGKQFPAPKPQLRAVTERPPLVAPERTRLDAVTRESHVRMIGHLRRRYALQVLVDQAIFGKGSVDLLSDDDLMALHRDLERARECIADGISLEDAGLLRSRCA